MEMTVAREAEQGELPAVRTEEPLKQAQPHRNFTKRNRNWTTVRRHLPIVLKPTFVALAVALVWRFLLFPAGLDFGNDGREPISLIVIVLVGFIYVIFAGVAVTSVFDQYKAVSKAVVSKNVDEFLLYRDEKLPIMMHLLVGAPSFLLAGAVMLFEYRNPTVGSTVVFSVTFVLFLIWVITTELDEFMRGIWFQDKVPPEWYDIDIDSHFARRESQSAALRNLMLLGREP